MRKITLSEKDPSQFAIYDAEDLFEKDPRVVHYKDKDEAMEFIRLVVKSSIWKELSGPKKVTVRITRHDSAIASCMPDKNQINLPGWGLNSLTILHEMAHLISSDGHGPKFATGALMLYKEFICEEFADNVRAAYYRVGASFRDELG